MLAEKKYDNGMTWALGAVNGWDRDNGADFNKSKSLLGRIGWQGDNYGALLNMIYGAEQAYDDDQQAWPRRPGLQRPTRSKSCPCT